MAVTKGERMSDLLFGIEDTHGIGLDLKIGMGEISPREIWEEKDFFIGLATTSRGEIWESLNEEEREALLRLSRTAVEVLHANVGAWVPEDLKAEGGEWVDVDFRIRLSDLTNEIANDAEALSAAALEAQVDTLEMLEGLDR